jgi:hypothetical protein
LLTAADEIRGQIQVIDVDHVLQDSQVTVVVTEILNEETIVQSDRKAVPAEIKYREVLGVRVRLVGPSLDRCAGSTAINWSLSSLNDAGPFVGEISRFKVPSGMCGLL